MTPHEVRASLTEIAYRCQVVGPDITHTGLTDYELRHLYNVLAGLKIRTAELMQNLRERYEHAEPS